MAALILFNSCSNPESDTIVTEIPQQINGVIKIKNWTAFGPFKFDTLRQKPIQTIFNDNLAISGIKENEVNEDNLTILKRKFKGLDIHEKDGFIDAFNYTFNAGNNESNFYFFTTVYSKVDQTVSIALDYAAGAMLWLNNTKVFEAHHKHNTLRKIDRFINVSLKKGTNTLLMKLNRETNINAWKFVFYITSINYAKEIYKANYIEDFADNPNVIQDQLKIYLGPYAASSVKALYITPVGSKQFFQKTWSAKSNSANSLFANLSGLPPGFYQCKLVLDKDTLQETIYKGDLFQFEKNINKEISLLKLNPLIKNELDINQLKFSALTHSTDDLFSESDQRSLQKRRVFFGYSLYNAVKYVQSGNKSFGGLAGTYIKTYYSVKQKRYYPFLYHINKQVIDKGKVPLVLVIPYTLGFDNFIEEGYFDSMPQLEADIMLADKYGYAIAWPFLGGKSTSPFKMEDDIENVLRKLKKDYRIDKRHVNLLGDSEGGQRALSLAINHPDRYNKIVLFVPGQLASWAEESKANFSKLKGHPILIACAKDDSFHKNSVMLFIDKVTKEGLDVKYQEYDGGHESYKKDHRKIGFDFLKASN